MTDLSIQNPAPSGLPGAAAKAADSGSDFGDFLDSLVDIVNPLQHLPVVSTLYRSLTGDEIAAPARMIGGALFGGPLGAAGALVNLIVEDATGRDIGDHALALLSDDSAGEQLASLDGAVPAAPRREPVMVAYGDANAMMPDAVAWNGEWRAPGAPSGQQASTAPPLPPAATPPVATPPSPSAKDAAALPLPAPVPPAVPAAATATPAAPLDAPMTKPAAAPAEASAKPPEAPAWLAAALSRAEQSRATAATGREPVPQETPEWVSSAMAHALDKYQTMAISRADAATGKDVGRSAADAQDD